MQTSTIELFAIAVNSFYPLTNFAKSFIVNVWGDPKYASASGDIIFFNKIILSHELLKLPQQGQLIGEIIFLKIELDRNLQNSLIKENMNFKNWVDKLMKNLKSGDYATKGF